MKIADENQAQGTEVQVEIESAPLPSRTMVQTELNSRARNDEMDQSITRTRTPFGAGKLRLGVTKIPGYHMHWIADYAGRLEEAEGNGYEYVTNDEVKLSRGSDSASQRVSRVNGVHDNGRVLTLWLMKIREDWYEENQQYYLERVRKVERQIKSGYIDGKRSPETYIPKGATNTISTKRE